MIYLQNNKKNDNIVFVATAPSIFDIELHSKKDSTVITIQCTNKLLYNTKADITLVDVFSGEYIYKLIGDNVELERGICEVINEELNPNNISYDGGIDTIIAY
jgi:hypothetical protein